MQRERAQGKDMENTALQVPSTQISRRQESKVLFGCGLEAILKRKFTQREKGKFNSIHFSLQKSEWRLSFSTGPSFLWTHMVTASGRSWHNMPPCCLRWCHPSICRTRRSRAVLVDKISTVAFQLRWPPGSQLRARGSKNVAPKCFGYRCCSESHRTAVSSLRVGWHHRSSMVAFLLSFVEFLESTRQPLGESISNLWNLTALSEHSELQLDRIEFLS